MPFTRRRFLGTALALACAPRAAGAAVAAPAGVDAREWLARWLAAFNGDDLRTYARFVRRHVPTLVPYLDDDLGLREASGGFHLLRSEITGPREVTAWVRDRGWDRFSRVVLTAGDGRIDDVAFLGAPVPADFHLPRLDEAGALEQLRRKLRAEAAAGRFSGAVLVARDGTVLFREAYGARTAAPARAAAPDTRFCIGSTGKMFTAVAVLQRVRSGALRLDDTVGTLLPDHPDTPLARQVTVEHLLTHSGGTGDFFGPVYDARQAELRTLADFIRVFGEREPAFAAGSRWGYSNYGFILLGAILERVAGMPWDACLERDVFVPAGMTSTSPFADGANTARPLSGARQTGLRTLPFHAGLPAGGGYSTVDDLHRFAVALREHRLLDAAHLDLLTRPRIDAGSARWSLGLRTAVRNGAPWYGHGGSAPGVNADFAIYPQSGYHVVVLANRGHPHALNVAEHVGARLPLR